MNHSFYLSILTLCLVANGLYAQYCTTDSRFSETAYFDTTEITVGSNIQFGVAQDVNGNPYPLLMDLYYPNLAIDTLTQRPFIMLFHGGGFSSGDKLSGDIRDLSIHMARRGFVCASVNYRLGHDFSEYGQYKARYRAIQDGLAAMRFVVNNANLVRIDTNWLFVGGQSAGSLIALGMVHADQSELDSISLLYSTVSTSSELGNLNTSGNNLQNTFSVKGIFNNWGGVFENELDIADMLPTIAFHGELDTIVRIDSDTSFQHYSMLGSREIHNELIANSVCSEITVDTMGEHGIFRNASSEFRAQRASCFFKSIFCNTCSDFYSTDSIPANCSSTLTSLDTEPSYSSFIIYPNPASRTIYIQGPSRDLNISIYNTFGQLVQKEHSDNNSVHLNLPNGIYILEIRESATDELHRISLIIN